MHQLTARVLATLPVVTFGFGAAFAADPVANAGADVLVVDGQSVRVDGAASYHPDRKTLSYAWSVVDGTASIGDRTAVRPTIGLTSGAATLQLTVSDNKGVSATDTLVLSTSNLPPLAATSLDRRADVGMVLRLDATESTDPDGDRLTYAWRLVSAPEGSSAALRDASAVRPAFTPDAEGQYAFELVVTDQDGAASDPTILLVDTANAVPVADAGIDRAVATGAVVRLSAEGSYDLDGDFLGRHWKLLSKPSGSRARLAIGEDGRRAFTADRDGDYVLQLRVRDKQKVDAFDTVVVSAGGTVVRADAGQPQQVAADEIAVLIAASTAGGTTDGTALSYRWSLLSSPEGSAAVIKDAGSPVAGLPVDVAGDYVAQLTTTASDGSVGLDTVLLTTDELAPPVSAGPDLTFAEGDELSLTARAEGTLGGGFVWSRAGRQGQKTGLTSTGAAADISILQDAAPLKSVVRERDVVLPYDGTDRGKKLGLRLTSVGRTTDASGANVTVWQLRNTSADERSVRLVGVGTDVDAAYALPGRAEAYVTSPSASGSATHKLLVGNQQIDVKAAGTKAFKDNRPVIEPLRFAVRTRAVSLPYEGTDGGKLQGVRLTSLGRFGEGEAARTVWRIRNTAEAARSVVLDAVGNAYAETFDVPARTELYVASPAASGSATHKLLIGGLQADVKAAGNQAFEDDRPVADGEGSPTLLVYLQARYETSVGTTVDTVVLNAGNSRPVAVIEGPNEAAVGEAVRLVAASTDADGDVLSHEWRLLSAPSGSAASSVSTSSAQTDLTPDVPGTYVVQLTSADGALSSFPVTKVIQTTGAPPLAIASIIGEPRVGETLTLDGAASSDPDGDGLSYDWRITSRPDDSIASVLMSRMPAASFTPDAEGSYQAQLVVTDGEGLVDTTTVLFEAVASNRRPVLALVGNKTVSLGSTLRFALSGTDPDGDALLYSVGALPLPRGMTFDAVTGVLTYRPTTAVDRPVSLTFGVTDGVLSDLEQVQVAVTAPADGTVTTFTGRVISSTSGTVLSGAMVEIGNVQSVTDLEGRFSLVGVQAGQRTVVIWGPTGDRRYATTREIVQIVDGTINDIGRPITLAELEGVSTIVQAGAETVVEDTQKGFTLSVAADSVVSASDGSAYEGSLTVSHLTVEPASALPPGVVPCGLYGIEAKGAVFRQGAAVTLPNDDRLLPGTKVDVWILNRANFVRSGAGTVSTDGESVTATLVNIDDGAVFAIVPQGATATLDADQTGNVLRSNLLDAGTLQTTIATPAYRSLDQDRGMSLVYTSSAAAPTVTVSATADISALRTKPELVISQLTLGGVAAESVSTSVNANTPDRFAQSTVFDARAIRTGRYPGQLVTTSRYACSSVQTRSEGSFLVNNEAASPYGAGWTVSGLQRLMTASDGSVSVADGNGNVTAFDKPKEFGAVRESVAFDIKSESSPATGDVDNDGRVDFVAFETTTGNIVHYRNTDGTNFELAQSLNIRSGSSIFPRPSGEGGNVNDLELADLNGDGLLDLVVADDGSSTFILLNQDGEFAVSQTLPPAYSEIVLTDFDENGTTDIAIAEFDTALVFLNDGTGTFGDSGGVAGAAIRFPKAGAQEMNVLDVDLDGHLDFVNVQSNGLYVHWGEGILDFPESAQKVRVGEFISGKLGQRVGYIDSDRDGDVDFAISAGSGKDDAYVANLGNRQFEVVKLSRPDGVFYTDNLFMEDLDGNGLVDVVLDEREPQGRYVFHAQMFPGVFADPQIVVFGHILGEAKAIDVDGDGILDIVSKPRFNLFIDFANEGNRKDFLSPVTDFTTLVQNDDGTYTRRYKNGISITFGADGRQTAQTDSNGNQTTYAYDSAGRLTGITDPTGQSSVLTYGTGGRLRSVTDPGGRVTTYDQDADGLLVRAIDPEGNATGFAYDEQNRLIAQTNARGFTTEHIYGPGGVYEKSVLPDGNSVAVAAAKRFGLEGLNGGTAEAVASEDRISTVTDANGNVTTTEVNEYGAPIRVTDPLGRETRFERDANNLVIAVIEPSDVIGSGTVRTEFDYDRAGNMIAMREAVGTDLQRETTYAYEEKHSRLATQTDPDGFSKRWAYDGAGNPVAYTDQLSEANGSVAGYVHNDRGQQTSYTDLRGNETTYAYAAGSKNLLRMTSPEGDVTDYGYDAAGNLVQETRGVGTPDETSSSRVFLTTGDVSREIDGEGGETIYAYDAYYNLQSVTDPSGVVTTYEHDERNRLVATNDPALGRTVYAYDANGNTVGVTGADGQQTTYEYDEADRLVRSVDALGGVRRFAYDVRDNLVSVIDAAGNETTFVYDALDRPITRRNALGRTWRFGYDARDNRVRTTKPDGSVITSTYDARSDLTAMTGRGLDQRYAYDAVGNLLSATAGEIERAFGYDGANRLVEAVTSGLLGNARPNAQLAYAYDAIGRRSSMTDGFGGETAYAYDRRGALTELTTPSGALYAMTHDTAGRATGRAAPGVATAMAYDEDSGRMSGLTHGALNEFVYTYDARGDFTSIYEPGVRVRGYDHDALQRLTEVRTNGAVSESYRLDPEGNREESHLSASHVTGTANLLLSTDRWNYGYDLNGNRTSRRTKDGSEAWVYAYDLLDRLVEVRKDGALVEAYAYDALGDRSVITAADGSATGVIHDGPDRILDLVASAANDGGAPVRRYAHGGGVDEPFEVEAFAGGGGSRLATYTYHADHLGSVRTLSDGGGAAVGRYDYDSYGGLLSVEAPTMLGLRGQPFGYTGRERDAPTGLYHYRARAYDPETGTFLQEDPIGFAAGDLNTSRYVWNSPLSWTDPSGLVAAGEDAATRNGAGSSRGGLASIGRNLACKFDAMASMIEAAMNPNVETIGQVVMDAATGRCKAMTRPKRIRKRDRDDDGSRCPIGGSSPFSFPAGTLVWTEDGYVAIEDIAVGDEVFAWDADAGERVLSSVADTFGRIATDMVVLSYRNDRGEAGELRVTPEHPFATLDGALTGDWVEAARLSPGQVIFDVDGGAGATLASVRFEKAKEPVYNFEVAGTHSYFVGDDGLLSHNARIRGRKWRDVLCMNGGRCAYCDDPATTVDHIVAQKNGGSDDISNLAPACRPCNSSKGAKRLGDWLRAGGRRRR